jgi:hypothetical protein
MRILNLIVISLVLILLLFIQGKGCRQASYHNSGEAVYIHGSSCVVNNTVDSSLYTELLAWCQTEYNKHPNR